MSLSPTIRTIRAAGLAALALAFSPAASATGRSESFEYNEDFSILKEDQSIEKRVLRIYFGGYGGYNQLLAGYDGYENLGNVGAELWFRPVTFLVGEPRWYSNNFLTRLSVEWMPLQVPKGNYGLTEDMYAVTGQVVYKFDGRRDGGWMTFVGLGVGSYLDRLTLDTPATGEVTGTHTYLGLNGSVGFFSAALGPFRLTGEARYHRLRGPDGFWPQNVTYHGGIIYGFGENPYN